MIPIPAILSGFARFAEHRSCPDARFRITLEHERDYSFRSDDDSWPARSEHRFGPGVPLISPVETLTTEFRTSRRFDSKSDHLRACGPPPEMAKR